MPRRTLQIPLIFLILLSVIPIPTRADDNVSITIKMSGDAYVTIENNNGTLRFIYNGRDILQDAANKYEDALQNVIHDYKSAVGRINSNKLAIMLIRRDLIRLINALNKTFVDLYGKTYFLARVTGILGNSSRVTLSLKSGNMTLVDFIDQLLNTTEKQDMQITKLSLEVASNQQETREKLNKAFQEIYMNRAYIEDQLKILDEKINALSNKTNSTFTQVFNDLELLKMYEASNAHSTQIALICIGILNIIMVALIVWIAGWKAEKIKQQ